MSSPSLHEEKYDLHDEKLADVPTLAVAQFDDPNLDAEHIGSLEDDSPYPEVRSAVANTDDPDMPVNTFRAWLFGLIWAIIIPGLNQFFFFRYPSVNVGSVVAQLITFPMLRLWARVVPNVKVFGVQLNPGPFTVKEHVLITIMAGVGASSAYATDIVAVQRVFYNEQYNFAYQWMLVMSTQLIGFSIGGIARRFLVQPPSMIWPAQLVTCTLFNTLHSQQYDGIGTRGGLSRERFFTYALIGAFAWYFMPGYIFGALTYFNWVCWIAPENIIVNQIFGVVGGLGVSTITFDWSMISYVGSPLAWPWWAQANVAFAVVLFYWILTPILYFTNTWYAKYMPINNNKAYDNLGKKYNVLRILDESNNFDEEKYKAYSPLFLPTTFAISYGLSFASITATITHTFIYYRKQIWTQARRSMHEQADVHARLMAKYPQVPEWWYAIIFLSMFVFGIIVIECWPTQMPVWAFVLCLIISFVYVIPIGMVQAITNNQVGLNVITELIIGYALPGKAVPMMMFKTWGYITMAQALQFTADFKLGHYMKVPPRPMFWCQIVATVIAGTVQLGVQAWMFTNIEGMCDADQKDGFICANTTTFGTASVIWGVIGPARQFSAGQIYYGLCWFFLLGTLAPIVTRLVQWKFNFSWIRYINWPLIFSGTGNIPPATPYMYIAWCFVGFLFNYVVRRRHFAWWTKYNYVLSAALDAGTALASVFIFFVLQYPKNGTIGLDSILAWWGNNVFAETADWKKLPYRKLGVNETFGPTTW